MPRVRANGLEFHVEERGAGAPLVLLHGFTGSSESWWPVMDQLAGHRRVIAVDLVGHGRSDAPNDSGRYAFELALDDLAVIAASRGLGRATWLGYSMGGRLALGLAAQYPALVSALILESASPGLADAAERARRRNDDGNLARRIEEDGVEAFVAEWERLPLWDSQQSLPATTRERQRALRLANRAAGLAKSLRGMGHGAQPSLWERLTEIEAPTLLVAGSLDHKFVGIARRMAEAMPDATLAVAPHAGHTVHLESPEYFAERVLTFVSRPAGIAVVGR
jgi:2-succinyl-6-hydroxy-2,4-cyclohexadiene-1-carboxylate synthase